MKILLTGGTGYIGKAVLTRLVDAGHSVTAIVRSETSAAVVNAAGATAVVGDLFDSAWVASRMADVDAAIHTAAGSDADDARLNDSVIDAAISSLAGKPFVLTGGVWTYGSGSDITEESAPNPPAITAWRVEDEERLFASGVHAVEVQPSIVYGYGTGIVSMLIGGPRDESGALVLMGNGEQHWGTVHVDDLADLYLLALTAPSGLYIGTSGESPTVRELGEAYADSVVAGSAEELAGRVGEAFAEALLLDQQASGAKAKALGWSPSAPSLVELLADGYPTNR
jgi:nucleoside-diphosphate-sugar epimerase